MPQITPSFPEIYSSVAAGEDLLTGSQDKRDRLGEDELERKDSKQRSVTQSGVPFLELEHSTSSRFSSVQV